MNFISKSIKILEVPKKHDTTIHEGLNLKLRPKAFSSDG